MWNHNSTIVWYHIVRGLYHIILESSRASQVCEYTKYYGTEALASLWRNFLNIRYVGVRNVRRISYCNSFVRGREGPGGTISYYDTRLSIIIQYNIANTYQNPVLITERPQREFRKADIIKCQLCRDRSVCRQLCATPKPFLHCW